jgi:hypothetical protein
MVRSCLKRLTDTDLGVTGSHQAGFLVPKRFVKEGLFDDFGGRELNPRRRLKFEDLSDGSDVYGNFIFYNNKLFGGTRLEYRLTGISRWIKDRGLRVGDSIEITRQESDSYTLRPIKSQRAPSTLSRESWTAIYGKDSPHEHQF